MKNLVDFINEAISIPKKFDGPFELNELDLTDDEIKFLEKYLKTSTVYQLPAIDPDTDKSVKEFDNLNKLINSNKAKELETIKTEYGKYVAYELNDTTVVFVEDIIGMIGSDCFYLSTNKI